jgi:hypothetical protein
MQNGRIGRTEMPIGHCLIKVLKNTKQAEQSTKQTMQILNEVDKGI